MRRFDEGPIDEGAAMKTRAIVLMLVASLAAGCGLAGTATIAAGSGQSAAEQAKEGRKAEDKVRADVDAAQQQAAEARKAAEAAATGDGE
jgi:hypothetical protein